MEPEKIKKKKQKQKETRQRRDKGHAVKTSDAPREGRKNQEGRQAGKKKKRDQTTRHA